MPGRRAKNPIQPEVWLQATLLFGVPVFGSGMQYALLKPDSMAIAFAALLIGGAYVGLAAWVRRRPFCEAISSRSRGGTPCATSSGI